MKVKDHCCILLNRFKKKAHRGAGAVVSTPGLSPEFVMLRRIFHTHRTQLFLKPMAVDVQVVAQFVERAIAVAQFHVDEAHKHHRVVRQILIHDSKDVLQLRFLSQK